MLDSRIPVLGTLADIGQSIYQGVELSRLLALLPGNWTLFDFGSVNVAIDAFELYVSSDQQCLNYRATGPKDLLSCVFPPLATADQFEGANLVATRCWADAQQSIGTSNLLACTGSDTCYKSLYDTTQVVCVSCPEPGPTASTAAARSRARVRAGCRLWCLTAAPATRSATTPPPPAS